MGQICQQQAEPNDRDNQGWNGNGNNQGGTETVTNKGGMETTTAIKGGMAIVITKASAKTLIRALRHDNLIVFL